MLIVVLPSGVELIGTGSVDVTNRVFSFDKAKLIVTRGVRPDGSRSTIGDIVSGPIDGMVLDKIPCAMSGAYEYVIYGVTGYDLDA
jgi:hypothetical protein